MIGVVLWSDAAQRKAVIWCEDHGDLAFYREASDSTGMELDPGDLVQFDLTTERHLRFAHNPKLVSEGEHAPLPEELRAAAQQSVPVSAPEPASYTRQSAEIIPFAAAVAERRRQVTCISSARAAR